MDFPRYVIAILAALQAGPSFGQAAEACGSAQELLFHCTFRNGEKQVGICFSDGVVSYAFGADFVLPELAMARDVAEVDYTPFSWASNTIFESVALTNSDTVYEVFTTIERGPSENPAKGGIVVTLPNNAPITLSCDAGSVWPLDPFASIGQLSQILNR